MPDPATPPSSLIYNLCRRPDWEAAQRLGRYEGSADDRRDGFIHFSTATQVAESARRHRAGVADLLLLVIDVAPLGTALRWEPSRGGQLFPHLYAALPVSAVSAVHELPLGPDGIHVFPPLS
jgi:uncharacterized protein (DUF952 family)